MPLPVPFVTHPLTTRQRAVLDFVARSLDQHGVMPTPEEIAGRLGFDSVATAEQLLATLERKGWLESSARGAGSSAGGPALEDGRPSAPAFKSRQSRDDS